VIAEDAPLVRRCLQGDAAATRQLIEKFQGDVYGLCVRLLHDKHEAEDASQEAFIRVFRHLRRWDASRPLRPWIMSIAVNRCRTMLSRRVRQPDTVDYLHETAAAKLDDDAGELIQEIRTAVDSLRPEYRTVFILFHERHLPYEEVAEAIERPVGTVKTWLHRARMEVLERLRKRGMVTEVGHEMP
jgi:RNA polymerase sigma-70 factor (ECF subfamily)